MPTETLLHIDLSFACFCLVSVSGEVTESAPIAGWSVGRRTKDVADYYLGRGATVEYAKRVGEWKEYTK